MMRSRTMMYLAAAGALYAWRSYAKARRGTPSEHSRADAHGGVGITDLPPDAEQAHQDSLPPRGTRAGDYHA